MSKIIPNMKRIKRIHFVGIGGSGMSGIAEVLLNQGCTISGSDLNANSITDRLENIGIKICIGHNAANVKKADVLVVSTAIADDNAEVQIAHKKHIPVLRRAQMLGELMRLQHGIAIAGTHGKTTTTSLVASLLTEGELDPTFVIGGVLNSAGSNAQLGSSKFFVAEADESDASFLCLHPKMAVVTSIDADHMQTYGDDLNQLKHTFLEFLHRLPFYGLAVVCIDDPIIKQILPDIARPVITYGFDAAADVRAVKYKQHGIVSTFGVKSEKNTFEITLNLPGKHNVLNALAAIAIASECGVSETVIGNALAKFQGVSRRFQILGEFNLRQGKVTLIDDYGHHPKEIAVTLEAIQHAWPKRRLVHVFQPHRYTRTKALFDDFVTDLAKSDKLILLDIYPAGEEPIAGAGGEDLAAAIEQHGKDCIFIKNIADLSLALEAIMQDQDVLLLQGAGSIGKAATQLRDKFKYDSK